jgi:hypothetical protein
VNIFSFLCVTATCHCVCPYKEKGGDRSQSKCRPLEQIGDVLSMVAAIF